MIIDDILLLLLQGGPGVAFEASRKGWNKKTKVCEWEGITCNDDDDDPSSVIAITISNANLVGTTIPPEFSQLGSHLKQFIITKSGLQGTIPNEFIANATALEVINVSYNQFTGTLPIFYSSSNLILQDISHNQFTGMIPKGVLVGKKSTSDDGNTNEQVDGEGGEEGYYGTPHLTTFLASFNRFTGRIPEFDTVLYATTTTTTTATTSTLKELDLSSNRLTGPLPLLSLQQFVSLEKLYLSNNRLVGSIPEELFSIDISSSSPSSSLIELHMNGNQFTGTIPNTIARRLPQLEILLIDNNRFTGQIPTELCQLELNNALFDGSMNSVDISLLDETYMDVYGSSSGDGDGSRRNRSWRKRQRQRSLQQSSLTTGTTTTTTTTTAAAAAAAAAQRDGCTSIACPAGFIGGSSSNGSTNKRGVFPCQPCGEGQDSNTVNPYLGAHSCLSYVQDDIVQSLYDDTYGITWALNEEERQTWTDRSISLCSKTGISCNANGDVIRIVLEQRNLTGTIPSSLGFLPNLMELDVSHNGLQGTLPEELALPPLLILDVAENQLTGSIPGALCRKSGVNGNGKDDILSCDVIACPMQTYHPEGHADAGMKDGGFHCQPCGTPDSERLGQTKCIILEQSSSTSSEAAWIDLFMMAVLGFGILMGVVFVWRRSGVTKTFFQGRYSMATSSSSYPHQGNNMMMSNFEDEDTHIPAPVRTTSAIAPKTIFHVKDPELANLQIKVQDEWNMKKEDSDEVWMEVPTIR